MVEYSFLGLIRRLLFVSITRDLNFTCPVIKLRLCNFSTDRLLESLLAICLERLQVVNGKPELPAT